jgi:hypothetical protein
MTGNLQTSRMIVVFLKKDPTPCSCIYFTFGTFQRRFNAVHTKMKFVTIHGFETPRYQPLIHVFSNQHRIFSSEAAKKLV